MKSKALPGKSKRIVSSFLMRFAHKDCKALCKITLLVSHFFDAARVLTIDEVR